VNDDHKGKFPLELLERIIRLLSAPGEIVLGSETTADQTEQAIYWG